MKKIIYLLLILSSSGLYSQINSPQVINAAGMERISPTLSLSITDNVGEAFVSTVENGYMITQGFVQPMGLASPRFTVDIFVTDVSCTNKNDGRISTAITAKGQYQSLQYIWTPTTACPGNNCTSLDSLSAGNYSLMVIVTYTNASKNTITDTLKNYTKNKPTLTITDVNGPCKVKVFTGITLNGDGRNDFLFVDNISEFPNNRITVYNRWGTQLYDKQKYDNVNDVWPTADDASKLVSSTYFYVLDLGDGSKPLKGWIEVIKN